MKDILPHLETWLQAHEEIALATVISTWGSSPRPTGSKLALTRSGRIAGSVSAGCVENAVIEEGMQLFKDGVPRLLTYGVANETAWDVGLVCGGTIRVFVEPFRAWEGIYSAIRDSLESDHPVAVASIIEGPDAAQAHKLLIHADGQTGGSLDFGPRTPKVVETALDYLRQEKSDTFSLDEDTTLFIEAYPPQPRLVIIGAVHIAIPLVTMARTLGFKTIIIDPRTAFATAERFPHADEIITLWPQKAFEGLNLDGSTYIAALTHDPKIDDPALMAALNSPVRYVGVLGSRRTHEKRLIRLHEAGLTQEQLARLHAPIGLPLGGRRPEEIALSIMAEIVQVRAGQTPDDA